MKKQIYLVLCIILFLILACVVFNLFMNYDMNFEEYEQDRLEIIRMVKDNELVPDKLGNCIMPEQYKKLSQDGWIYIYQNDSEGQVISFWVLRGMQSGSKELIYSTGGEELIKANETGHPIISIEKLKDNWYYVVTDY